MLPDKLFKDHAMSFTLWSFLNLGICSSVSNNALGYFKRSTVLTVDQGMKSVRTSQMLNSPAALQLIEWMKSDSAESGSQSESSEILRRRHEISWQARLHMISSPICIFLGTFLVTNWRTNFALVLTDHHFRRTVETVVTSSYKCHHYTTFVSSPTLKCKRSKVLYPTETRSWVWLRCVEQPLVNHRSSIRDYPRIRHAHDWLIQMGLRSILRCWLAEFI